MDVPDYVLTFLVRYGLADAQESFWLNLREVSEDEEPGDRHYTIATIAVLMDLGKYSRHMIGAVVRALGRLSDEQLAESAVGVVNGLFMLLPRPDGSVHVVHGGSLERQEEPPPAFVTTVFSPAVVWNELQQMKQLPQPKA